MTTKDSTTPIDGDSSTCLPANQLARLEDQLNQLLACHAFYDLTIRAITSPDYNEELEGENHCWHFGLFLHQQSLHDQGQALIGELQTIQQRFNE